MKTRLLSLASSTLVAAILFLLPGLSNAAVTTLMSQDFSGGTFPPTGWSATNVASGNQTSFGASSVAWYRSAYGYNGTNGSAVANGMAAYSYYCYGTSYNGYLLSPITLTAPTVNLSGLPVGDTQFVDFDMFIPINGYQTGNNTNLGSYVYVMNGANTLTSFTVTKTSDGTVYTGQTVPSDPQNYTATTNWRHFHITIPSGTSSLQLAFKFDMYYAGCYYTYFYADIIAVDNIDVTTVHYDLLTLTGPTTLNFANQPVGSQSATQYVKFTNASTTKTYSLTNYTFGGANGNQFILTRSVATLAPGATDSVGVAYLPTQIGSKTATLNFNTNADNNQNVAINLTGFGSAPQIGLPPNLVLFAKTKTRFRKTLTQSFAVTALGTVPLSIAPQPLSYIGGDYPNEYKILRLPTSPIQPGKTDTVTVQFTAMIEGSTSGSLFLASNASNGTQEIPLHGVGIVPRLVINGVYNPFGNSINMPFDSVNVGTQRCKQMSFYNPGTDTLLILKNFLSSKDFDFSITPLTGSDSILAPEQTKTMNVCFTPLRNGFRMATLRVATNIPITFPVNPPVAPNTFGPDTSGFSVVLMGTGVPFGSIAVTGKSLDSALVGTQVCMNDTVWNTGSASITLTKGMLTGGDSDQFIVQGLTLPMNLSAGGFAAFQICGTPKTGGLHSTLFTGTAMQGDGSNVTAPFPVSVFGLKDCDTLMVATPFPAMTCVCGNADTATITVTNCGDIATAYTASITGLNAADYTIVGSSVSPMESAGGKATFMVAYKPTTRGNSVANFVITGGPGGTVALPGKGGAPNIAGTVMAPVTAKGNTSAPFTVTVTNTGECDWTPGTPMLAPGSAFTYAGIASEPTTKIAAGMSGTLTFTFSPTADGAVSETVTFPNASCAAIPTATVTLNAATAGVTGPTAQSGYSIEQNFPNPFNNETTISMTLPKDDIVKLTIIDQKGQIVRTVMNQQMAMGTFNVTVDASELASGTYYYQMSTSSVTLTRQMVIVK